MSLTQGGNLIAVNVNQITHMHPSDPNDTKSATVLYFNRVIDDQVDYILVDQSIHEIRSRQE